MVQNGPCEYSGSIYGLNQPSRLILLSGCVSKDGEYDVCEVGEECVCFPFSCIYSANWYSQKGNIIIWYINMHASGGLVLFCGGPSAKLPHKRGA